MPFVTPGTVVAGDVLTAARYNSDVVANTQYLNDSVGLVLVTTQSFTASATVSVNNCFSSAYTNYRVVFRCDGDLGSTSLDLRLRVGGVDNSTASSYLLQRLRASSTSVTASTTNQNFLEVGILSAPPFSDGNVFILDIVRPFDSTRTSFLGNGLQSGSTNLDLRLTSGLHDQSVSYDGMTFFTLTPDRTLTGDFWVYGYKD